MNIEGKLAGRVVKFQSFTFDEEDERGMKTGKKRKNCALSMRVLYGPHEGQILTFSGSLESEKAKERVLSALKAAGWDGRTNLGLLEKDDRAVQRALPNDCEMVVEMKEWKSAATGKSGTRPEVVFVNSIGVVWGEAMSAKDAGDAFASTFGAAGLPSPSWNEPAERGEPAYEDGLPAA